MKEHCDVAKLLEPNVNAEKRPEDRMKTDDDCACRGAVQNRSGNRSRRSVRHRCACRGGRDDCWPKAGSASNVGDPFRRCCLLRVAGSERLAALEPAESDRPLGGFTNSKHPRQSAQSAVAFCLLISSVPLW